ncbi:FxsB family cyclophane-forming radical SAM/SPASM peptide maturase [Streptomyces sp. MA5143a]|uniref:FxsB family cyclophane-forming radical SAM/SPASM peptide maturase n=1 Tax=Streptomyces sp. MA5143a TaxID=2083010 RepID=UPI000D1A879A|nr:FxsB family cyclophane-forming radical SAM/SPASM peptide maturase [Streptomyces sp. MA5143a]SPE99759.1 hypothetical protein SMA5143A_0468 [Streptomyces sp. MA5143a]
MTAVARPFRQFVIKVHSRCDLDCDHCYVYKHADQSWRGRPVTMSEETFARAAARIAEHAAAHRLPRVHVVLHGGEPLLAGRDRLRGFARVLRSALHGVAELDLRMQTNGLRLDNAFCAMLAEESIVTSISLDGDETSNDRHRIRPDGSGSYRAAVRAVRLMNLPAHRRAFGGLLCTVDVENDPVEVYRALAELSPPGVDFLLPHATWEYPPPRPRGETDYADWLIAVHKQWTADGMPMRIRIFESISRLTHGRGSLTEALGLGSSDLLVVETDGAIEQADWLKTAYPGAPDTDLHITANRLEEAAQHEGIQARRTGLPGLSAQCRACPVVAVCGGGLYGHRHRTSNGFDNPSVYCADLLKLIEYVQAAERSSTGVRHGWHGLSWTHFDELSAGYGSSAAIRSLASAQSSQRRALLAAAHRADGAGAGAATSARGWEAIRSLPPAALEVLLADPYLRVWALACGQSVQRAEGHPAEAALSAVARTGGQLSLPVPFRRGPEGTGIHLPGLGRLLLRAGSPCQVLPEVTLTVSGEAITVEGRRLDREQPPDGMIWQSLRRLSADGLEVAFDDIDPSRGCYGYRPRPRLPESEFRSWQDMFREAWRLIRSEYPGYADAIAAGLVTVTPLAASSSGADVSATSRHAFGAVGIALPRSADDLALLLVHEYQHVKLGAMLDMFDLVDGTDVRRHEVGWRPDPRPLDAVIQGAYAHLAVADIWRARSRRGATAARPAAAGRPPAEAEKWRRAVLDALDIMAGTGSLTALGHRFARVLRAKAEALGGVAETGPVTV